MKTICLVYTIVLTVLLLADEPLDLTGMDPVFLDWLLPSAHLTSFTLLTVLALASRWPVPRWAVILVLAAYGGCTELAQSLVTRRTPEWGDFVQDLGGVGVGLAIWWVGVQAWNHLQARRCGGQPPLPGAESAPDEC